MKDLISVIVPVYNVEDYISKCIDSIIAQTYQNLEIILVDDGSTDKSGNICDYYSKKDSRIHTFHKKNGGLSSARNLGINNAKGNYLYFVDSDDFIENKTIKILYDTLKATKSDIASCGVRKKWDSSFELFSNEKITVSGIQAAIEMLGIKKKVLPVVWNKLFKTSLIKNLRFDENIKFGEDTPFTVQALAMCQRYSSVSYVGYNYNVRNTSLIGNTFSLKHMYALQAADEVIKICSEKFPDLRVAARMHKYDEAYILYTRMIVSGTCDQYKAEYQTLLKEIKKYTVLDVYKSLGLKTAIEKIIIDISPTYFEKIYPKLKKSG